MSPKVWNSPQPKAGIDPIQISRLFTYDQERDEFMKLQRKVVDALSITCALSLAWPVLAQDEKQEKKVAEGEKKAEGDKGEKAKGEKVSGDIGLLDTEKNYMIVVTKEGKLVTVDFDQKTKVTELKASDAKMGDIGLGSSATVQYTKKGEKSYVSGIEFTPAKGGD
jgi:hypothetical protein